MAKVHPSMVEPPPDQEGYGAQPAAGPYPGPSYHTNTVNQQAMVVMAGAPPVVVDRGPVYEKHKYLGFSIFVCLCCDLLCGIIAIIFAALADGTSSSTNTYNTVSLVFCILALLSGFAIWGVLIWYILVVIIFVGSAAG